MDGRAALTTSHTVGIRDVSTDLAALRNGAALCSRDGNRVAAIALLWASVAIAPTDLVSHRRLAAALANAGDVAGAADEYGRYIEFVLPLGDVQRARLELEYARSTLGDHPALRAAAERVAAASPWPGLGAPQRSLALRRTPASGRTPASSSGRVPTGVRRGLRSLGLISMALAWAVPGALIALAALFMVFNALGLSSYVVMSGSMLPTLPMGSVVVVEPVPASAVRPGDIVTFDLTDRTVTHRVVAVEASEAGPLFTTKGDANAEADVQKIRASTIGLVRSYVPAIGYGVVYAQAYWRLGALAILALIFVWAARSFIRPSPSRSHIAAAA